MHSSSEKEKDESISYISSSKTKLAAILEDGPDLTYDPAKHRAPINALGTTGALFHMIKGSLGSGILSMPVAFKNGGLWVSLVGTIIIGLICTHCVNLLVKCSQELCKRVKQPCLGYAATAEAAFLTGPAKLRRHSAAVREFVDSSLMITYYFGNTVYIVFIASSLQQVVEANFDLNLNTRFYVLMTSVVIIPVGMIRELKYLVPFSFFAILFLLFGCGFVLYEVFLDLPPLTSRPSFTSFQRLPLFYSTVLFALEGIGTVLPIENAMRKPQYFLGCPGVLNTAMILLVSVYTVIGFFGYLRYGEDTEGSVTLNLASSAVGEIVKMLVAGNVLFSYGLCFFVPCEICWRKLEPMVRLENKTSAYYGMRTVLVLGTLCLACALPDLEPFVGLVGAIFYSTLGLLFPAVIELVSFWDDPGFLGIFYWRLFKNIVLMIMWIIALTSGTQASINRIFETFS